MGVGATAYINDQLGLHAVRCHDAACEEGEEGSVSLHICECAPPAAPVALACPGPALVCLCGRRCTLSCSALPQVAALGLITCLCW